MTVDLGGGDSGDIQIYQNDDPAVLAQDFIAKRGLDGQTLIPGEGGSLMKLQDRLRLYIGTPRVCVTVHHRTGELWSVQPCVYGVVARHDATGVCHCDPTS